MTNTLSIPLIVRPMKSETNHFGTIGDTELGLSQGLRIWSRVAAILPGQHPFKLHLRHNAPFPDLKGRNVARTGSPIHGPPADTQNGGGFVNRIRLRFPNSLRHFLWSLRYQTAHHD